MEAEQGFACPRRAGREEPHLLPQAVGQVRIRSRRAGERPVLEPEHDHLVERHAARLGEIEQRDSGDRPRLSTNPRSASSAPSLPGRTSPRAAGRSSSGSSDAAPPRTARAASSSRSEREGGLDDAPRSRSWPIRTSRRPGFEAAGRACRAGRSPAGSPPPASGPSAVRARRRAPPHRRLERVHLRRIGTGVRAAKPRDQAVDRLGAVLVEREREQRHERACERGSGERTAHAVGHRPRLRRGRARSPARCSAGAGDDCDAVGWRPARRARRRGRPPSGGRRPSPPPRTTRPRGPRRRRIGAARGSDAGGRVSLGVSHHAIGFRRPRDTLVARAKTRRPAS